MRRVAAVDIGTNTVRLLVADVGEAVTDIERDQRITRLGEGVDAAGELGAEPMRRTLEAVEAFADRARAMGAERVRIAGTSALRDARNRDDFAGMIRAACGLPLEVLEGKAEGKLAYAGATSWLGEGRFVVCDIGGGSTELITSTEVASVDVGSVRVRERCLREDPPTAEQLGAARSMVHESVQEAVVSLGPLAGSRLVGVAGTITTLAALDAGLQTYDSSVVHGYLLSSARVHRWAVQLNRLSAAEVRGLGPVEPGRADVIGAGALVLEAVVDTLGVDEVIVSERDILHGLAAELVG